ncbi:HdeD family acid-resistance protein [Jannaschia sp. R86511]|uniref:HdeD family acid-resistance protein n=1 Tax=Jannaschia sp. R86511 TaxID=3093853 RepID=UPI0036D337C1
MSSLVLEQRRTAWDVILGLVLVVAGFVVLGNTVVATAFSVGVLGWFTLFSGLVLLVSGLLRIGKDGFWSAALGGGLLVVLGIVMLRNPAVTALTITLVAGSMFLATGLTRVVVSFQHPQSRLVLLVSGLISAALGLMVLFNIVAATFTLLGVLLGVQALVEGITLIALGRLRPVRDDATTTTSTRRGATRTAAAS